MPTYAPTSVPIPPPTMKPTAVPIPSPTVPAPAASPTVSPTTAIIADVSSALVLSGMTAAEFGVTQQATFKTALVATFAFLSSTDDVTSCEASDVTRRRRLLSSEIEVAFTMEFNVLEAGLPVDVSAIESAVAADLTASVESGNFSAAIADAASASNDETLAGAVVDVDKSVSTIASSTSAALVVTDDAPSEKKNKSDSNVFMLVVIVASCVFGALILLCVGSFACAKMRGGGNEAPQLLETEMVENPSASNELVCNESNSPISPRSNIQEA